MRTRRFAHALLAAAPLVGASAHAADAAVPAGLAVYDKVCAACHQAGGKGMVGLAPALAGTLAPVVGKDEGRAYITGVLVHGLSGKIVSQGQTFMAAMPVQTALSDTELADVANHVARDLNGAAESAFKADDFAKARSATTTHKDLRDLRAKLLP